MIYPYRNGISQEKDTTSRDKKNYNPPSKNTQKHVVNNEYPVLMEEIT